MKKILSLAGPAFSSNKALIDELPDREVDFNERSLMLDSSKDLMADIDSLGSNDLIIIRAPLTPTAEDLLVTKICYSKIADSISLYASKPVSERPKVFALGRASLLFLEHYTNSSYRSWTWHTHFKDLAPFAEVSIFMKDGTEEIAFARFWGLLASSPADSKFSDWDTWIRLHDDIIGWRIGNCFLSLVDVFSLKRLSQLDNYGYKELNAKVGSNYFNYFYNEAF